MALGAGRGSIVRQMLTESLLLSGFGGTAGLLLGYLGRNVVPRLLTSSSQLDQVQVQFDWRVLLFTLAISFATGITFWTGACLAGDAHRGSRGTPRIGRRHCQSTKALV